jgi:hypothetical protein
LICSCFERTGSPGIRPACGLPDPPPGEGPEDKRQRVVPPLAVDVVVAVFFVRTSMADTCFLGASAGLLNALDRQKVNRFLPRALVSGV